MATKKAAKKAAMTVGGKPVKKKAAPKPKKVTLLDTELEPLKEADMILKKIEVAERECDERAIEVDQVREELKNAKGSYADAVRRLRKLCRMRKEKHPLFDKPKEQAPAKPAANNATLEKPAVQLPKVVVSEGSELHGIKVDTVVFVEFVKPGGVIVSADGINPTALTDEEYTANDETAKLIADARGEKVLSDKDGWLAFVAERTKSQGPKKDDWKRLPLEDAGINGNIGRLLVEAGHDTLGKLAQLMNVHGQWWPKEVKGIGEGGATEVADRFADFWAKHPEYCE